VHAIALDGVFSEGENGEAKFFEATELGKEVVEKTGQQIRERVLRYLKKQGVLEPHEAEDMLTWEHGGGFSLDASVRISGWDRDGLEKLARYCARPSFAEQRLTPLAVRLIRTCLQTPSLMPCVSNPPLAHLLGDLPVRPAEVGGLPSKSPDTTCPR